MAGELRKLNKKRSHQRYVLPSGKSVPGCSTICRLTDDSSEGLMGWAFKLGQQGIDFRKARDEAAEIGTVAHFLVECFLKNEEADLSDFSPNVVDKGRQAYEKFIEFWEREGFTPICSELQMASALYEYGGTLDCVAMDRDSRKTLLDIKVTTRHADSHLYQLAGYQHLYEETRGEQLERFCVVRLPKTSGAADPRWIQSLDPQWEVFQNQLNLYYSLQRCRNSS